MNLEELIARVKAGNFIEPTAHRVELKRNWDKDFGKKISAIANDVANDLIAGKEKSSGWIVLGVSDNGVVEGYDQNWLANIEAKVSSHLFRMLSPHWAVVCIQPYKFK